MTRQTKPWLHGTAAPPPQLQKAIIIMGNDLNMRGDAVEGMASRQADRATHEPNPQAVSAVPVGIPDAHDIWSEHLTEPQLVMVIESGNEGFFPGGHGVELFGSGAWRVARSLVAKGLGTIEGGAPQGLSLPGLYFNNDEGARIVGEFDEEEERDD